jgi:hypothetical protein
MFSAIEPKELRFHFLHKHPPARKAS